MGVFQSKDTNVELYLETRKDYYLSGQYLDGTVYINCLKQSAYTKLYLKFLCNEKVFWDQGTSQNTLKFTNYAKPYAQIIPICQFQNKRIPQGQFAYPFKFLLPSGLPGSICGDDQNQIKYSLIAQLQPQIKHQRILKFTVTVHIIEPFRYEISSINSQSFTRIRKCGCCGDFGTVQLRLNCDKNYINPGKFLKIKVEIDNRLCLKEVSNIKVLLIRNKVFYASERHMRHLRDRILIIYEKKVRIHAGHKNFLQFHKVIPKQFSNQSTSIGSIIASYFTLKLVVQSEGTTNNGQCEVHLAYHALNQKIIKNSNIKRKQSWNPKFQKQVVYNDLNPYRFTPMKGISYHYGRDQNPQRNQNLSKMTEMSYSLGQDQKQLKTGRQYLLSSKKQ